MDAFHIYFKSEIYFNGKLYLVGENGGDYSSPACFLHHAAGDTIPTNFWSEDYPEEIPTKTPDIFSGCGGEWKPEFDDNEDIKAYKFWVKVPELGSVYNASRVMEQADAAILRQDENDLGKSISVVSPGHNPVEAAARLFAAKKMTFKELRRIIRENL